MFKKVVMYNQGGENICCSAFHEHAQFRVLSYVMIVCSLFTEHDKLPARNKVVSHFSFVKKLLRTNLLICFRKCGIHIVQLQPYTVHRCDLFWNFVLH